ncbi:hypothetical protein V5O48_019558, partial [Marasmius crinis-equi]
PDAQSWPDALTEYLSQCPLVATNIMDHFQEQWECRNAADDFSRMYKDKLFSFGSGGRGNVSLNGLVQDELVNDLEWQAGQEDIGCAYTMNDVEDTDEDEGFRESVSVAARGTVLVTTALARVAG